MRGQVKIQQKKLSARRRRRAAFLLLYAVAAAGLIFCGLSYISQLGVFSIDAVEVQGNQLLPASAIQALVWKDVAGNYAAFFSRSDAFLYPRAQIQRDLLALPIVKSVSVSRRGLKTIEVAIVERAPAGRWCAGGESAAAPSGAAAPDCYSLDENGFVFAKEACATSSVCVKDSVGTSTAPGFSYRGLIAGDPVGRNLLPPVDFKKVSFFMSQLAGLAVAPRVVDLSGTSTDIYMNVILDAGGKLVINTADDLSAVLGDISAVISDRAIVPSLPQFLSSLDYMKLDIGNKVVYKMKAK